MGRSWSVLRVALPALVFMAGAGGVRAEDGAADFGNDVMVGALVADFHLAVAMSLLAPVDGPEPGPASGLPAGAVDGAVQLLPLTGTTKDGGADGLSGELDAFLAFVLGAGQDVQLPLSAETARAFACQLVGVNPVAHAALGHRAGIDAAGAASCAKVFQSASVSWNERLSPLRRGAGLTPPEGSGPLYVEIAPALEPAQEAIAAALVASGIFDALAERLNAELALPYARVLLVTECGAPGLFFNPARREIVLCGERVAAWIVALGK